MHMETYLSTVDIINAAKYQLNSLELTHITLTCSRLSLLFTMHSFWDVLGRFWKHFRCRKAQLACKHEKAIALWHRQTWQFGRNIKSHVTPLKNADQNIDYIEPSEQKLNASMRCFAPLVSHHFSFEAHQTPRSDL